MDLSIDRQKCYHDAYVVCQQTKTLDHLKQHLNGFQDSHDIDIDVDDHVDDDSQPPANEAKIFESNGRINEDENKSGNKIVELCQQTVNPNNKVGSEDFKILKTIGKGGYGTVYLVQKITQKNKNELFAMKVLKKARIIRSAKDTAHTVSERNILEMLQHPFLVKLHYAFQSHSYLYIVLEYCSGGELFNYLESIVSPNESSACFYTAEIALAIGHLHTLGIIYRDLKSENILLDKDGHVKLTDFGLSKEGVCLTNTFCGTIEYMAPEIIRCSGHGREVDWWSLGTLLYDMMSGGPPFYLESNRSDTAQNILYAEIRFPEKFSPEAISFISGLLTRDPKIRLGSVNDVEEIKAHQFFRKNNINWQDVYDRKLTPPFKPILSSATDVSMFDKNFTNLKPAVSPIDGKSAIAPDLFQGFSYVASSICDIRNLAPDDATSLRSDRSQLLANSKLNVTAGSVHDNAFQLQRAPPRFQDTKMASSHCESSLLNGRLLPLEEDQGPIFLRMNNESSNAKDSLIQSDSINVEPAADCLLMDVDSTTIHKSNPIHLPGLQPDLNGHNGVNKMSKQIPIQQISRGNSSSLLSGTMNKLGNPTTNKRSSEHSGSVTQDATCQQSGSTKLEIPATAPGNTNCNLM